jgi:hypothetical protein
MEQKSLWQRWWLTLIKSLLINICHRLHYHQQPPEDPKSSIIADGEPRQVFWKVSFKPKSKLGELSELHNGTSEIHLKNSAP